MPASGNRPASVILNVDDNESVRYARGRTLTKAGYHIIDAATGEEALRLAAAHQPDLVLLDISLPDLDGTEVCHRLKVHKDTSHIMVLQISSVHTSKMDVTVGLEGGADSYLVEPIDPLELLTTVKALLRLAVREEENRLLILQLRRTERQFREATSAADCGIWDWDIGTGKLDWFGAHERLAGMLPGGFSGKIDVFSEILHPDDRTRVWQRLQGMMERAEEHYSDEYRFVHPDGSVHWMTARGRFLYDDTGQAIRMTGVVQDITDHKQTEETLSILKRALSASDTGVLVVDATATDLPIIFASAGFERLSGYQAAEVLGRNCRFLQGPETDRTQIGHLRAALDAGHSIRVVLRNYRKNGTAFWNDLSITPVHNAAGHLTHFVGVQNDVTALIDTEHALRQSEERLRLANDQLEMRVQERTGELLATQQRLMTVTSQLSLTEQQERRKVARELHDHLAQMLILGKMKTGVLKQHVTSGHEGMTLLQDLDGLFQQTLTYTRTLIAELSPPSLQDAGLPAALKWLSERFQKDGLRVDVRTDRDSVPLPEEHAVVVFQAVRELLFNVLKHAGVGQATVTVTVIHDDLLRLVVTDHGKGCRPEALQRSFEPGHLGLIGVRERFCAMRGRVEVVSLPGKGTTVTLELPLAGGESGGCAVSKR